MVYFNQQIKEDIKMNPIEQRKNNSTKYVDVRKLNKNEHCFVNPDDVE